MSHADYIRTWARGHGCWGLDMTVDSSFGPARAVVFWPDRLIARIDGEVQALMLPPSVLVLLTHLVDAGERLTLGRCPVCEGQGVQWQWGEGGTGPWTPRDSARYKAPYSVHYAARICPACSEPGEPVECKACDYAVSADEDGYKRAGAGHGYVECATPAPAGSPSEDFGADLAGREIRLIRCPDCKGTGSQPGALVPTGLRRVSAAEALLLARPGPWSSRSIEAVHGEPDKDTAILLQATMDKWADAGHEVERLTNHVFRERKPGDPDARAALHEYADRRQDAGDALGRWLALGLSGAPCEACEGDGCAEDLNTGLIADAPCPACHGDGTALGQQLDAMVRPRWPALKHCKDDRIDSMAWAVQTLLAQAT